ncbi:MAG TPA: Fur family transcriptional regulator [Acidimicrobiales bacterium]|nr:Fur family transcriptional regulator [Acidimicrobiales bacterium]
MTRKGVERSGEAFVEELRSAALRATPQRLAVLDALRRQPHVDTDTVISHVRDGLGAVSAQAVYNGLAALVEAGLVRRIEPAGSVALYELRVGDNHHHVVCRKCGAVADVDCAVRRRPCLTPSDAHGYLLDEAEVTYWGICPACQAETGLVALAGPADDAATESNNPIEGGRP